VVLGIVSNTGRETGERMRALLDDAGLLGLFEPNLLLFSSVEGIDETDKEMVRRACTRPAMPAQRCIFVGESEAERKVAMSAQLRVSYHLLHAFFVLGQLLEGH
jgi:phosphoglycolate phosphatase-like HAD superfamily hydrolase